MNLAWRQTKPIPQVAAQVSPAQLVPCVCRGGDGEQPSCFQASLAARGVRLLLPSIPNLGKITHSICGAGGMFSLSQPHFVIRCRPTRQVRSRAFAVLIPASRSELHWLFSQRRVQSSADALLALPVQLLAVPPEGAQTAATTTHAVCSPC